MLDNEWWRDLSLLAVGGLLTLIGTLASHWLTARTQEKTETRLEARRILAEERGARRQERQRRIEPVRVFLNELQSYSVHEASYKLLTERIEARVNELAKARGMTEDDARRTIRDLEDDWQIKETSWNQFLSLAKSMGIAIRLSPTQEIREKVATCVQVAFEISAGSDVESAKELSDLIEDYIAQV